MTALTALLTLALSQSSAEPHYPGAAAVYQCAFDASREYDIAGPPPGWTQRHGPGYPRYVRARVSEKHPPSGGGSVRVELDGGAAATFGPPVAVNTNLQYVLEGYIETSGLQHDAAYLTLNFVDAERNKISAVMSEKLSGNSPWKKVCIGPVLPPAGAVSMIAGLNVEPLDEMQDLRGTAWFGGLWLGQLPRVALTARSAGGNAADPSKTPRNSTDGNSRPARGAGDATFLVFPLGQPIEIACVVAGFPAAAYDVQLLLLDGEGRMVGEHRESFTKSPAEKLPTARAAWRLPCDALGYYQVRAIAVQTGAPAAKAKPESTSPVELAFAVIEPRTLPSGSEFGWSLDPKDEELGLAPLGDMLGQCGIHWVKLPFTVHETREAAVPPVGMDLKTKAGKGPAPANRPLKPELGRPRNASPAAASQDNSIESLIDFSDRLSMAGVNLIGVLQPPKVSADDTGRSYELLAAEAFARDPKTWYPSIEPVLARLGTEIRHWQIGDDRDAGWVGCRDMPGIVERTKAQLDKIGQNLDVGLAWDLAAPLPKVPARPKANGKPEAIAASRAAAVVQPNAPWRFLSLSCAASTSNEAIARCLDNEKPPSAGRWVVLDTLPREGHASGERISHLVGRMVTAKMHGADGIFVAAPFDAKLGLFDRRGYPSELFVPWRTTALMLGGAAYVGDIDMPLGNRIHCFAGNGRYVGLIAGPMPGSDLVNLGEAMRLCDLCGNSKPCPPTINVEGQKPESKANALSAVPVERTPAFLTDLDGPITQWQLDAGFSPDRLPSTPLAIMPVSLELRNSFPQSISGQVTVHGPKNWRIEPLSAEFRLDPRGQWIHRLDVALPNDILGGRQMVRLDFDIQADRHYRFTMYRPLTVTLGDVFFEGRAALNDRGELEVCQTMINSGKRAAAFRCNLFAPDRQRQSNVIVVQPLGKSDIIYRLADGEQLLGKSIWLRAEEIDGSHVLNLRIEAPAAAPPKETPERGPASRPGSSLVL
jgi:hypothetical protein